MGLKTKFKSFFLLDDEYDDQEEEMMEKEYEPEPEPPAQKPVRHARQNVVSLQSVQKSSKVILEEPRVYADAQEIADHLKNRRAVVVNLQSMPHDQAKRIVDFLSGTVYAIAGDIQRIGSNIFLCTPDNVEVSGKISEFLQEQDYNDTRWP
ncbi:cell division protein SepF [Weizmannia acidilactici]|jgi:cell division inhibitor SepF|uniref:Cell division protein SepF n=1 Tax=Weizmannia acidilactici TaxID=2607726 RepID=A0A5J4J698_9BACI|nr:cell division protein SepF [Weizmannia acidilactici]GER65536.1 cell division protein SepF [Weizmannia acidilactici]GER70452.1 cell division protein SepF [Weizmannia acidilactici]GER74076.1 cell division protein SepF [Weizmannia acidilactici]